MSLYTSKKNYMSKDEGRYNFQGFKKKRFKRSVTLSFLRIKLFRNFLWDSNGTITVNDRKVTVSDFILTGRA